MLKNLARSGSATALARRMLAWHARHALGRTPSPLSCGMYITNRCNFRCVFCNIWRADPPFSIDAATARRIAAELGRAGTAYFSISGGEPLLAPHLFETLAAARAAGISYTHMVSNGWLMDADKARAMAQARLSEVSFSIDGDAARHDAQRGAPGAHDRVLAAVELVKTHAPGVRIVLNTILDPARPDMALAAVDTAARLGVSIKVQPANDHPVLGAPQPARRAVRNLDPKQARELRYNLDRLQAHPAMASSRTFLEGYWRFLFEPDRLPLAGRDCLYGYHHMELLGPMAFPCLEGMGWSGGFSLEDRSLAGLLRSDEYRAAARSLRSCSGCRKNYYVCYYEPRIHFPLGNLIRHGLGRWV